MIEHPLSDDARLTDSAKGTAVGSATKTLSGAEGAQARERIAALLNTPKDSSTIHYDEDTIPHGACDDPIRCDCALRALVEEWRSENGDYPESKQDCADELDAVLRSPVERTHEEQEQDDLARRDTNDLPRPRSAASENGR